MKDIEDMENTNDQIIRVFIIRHGQTNWNIEKILQGHKDIPLNKIGKLQAKLLGKRFENIKFDCWISSDLTRCIETLQGIEEVIGNNTDTNNNRRFIKSSSFRERYMGQVEGMKLEEARNKFGNDFRNKFGESKDEMIERIYPCWVTCLEECAKNGDKNVLLCTHGGVINNFVNYLYNEKGFKLSESSGLTRDDLRVPYNTSVSVVDVYKNNVEINGVIELFGCTLHLGEQREVLDKDLR